MKDMEKANPQLLSDLKDFLGELKSMKKEKAFEVACGACFVTKQILSK